MIEAKGFEGHEMAERLFQRFSLLSAGLWVGAALILGSAITYLVEQKMLEQATLASLHYFKDLARFITAKEEFVRLRTGAEYEAFDRLIRGNFLTSHVVTIKIYDRSGTTIYHSRRPELVGKAFPDNRPLQQAFLGETVVGLSDLKGSEHLAERQAGYSRLFEVYIPIFLEGTSRIIGAYEIYSPIDPFYQKVQTLRITVWSAVIFGLILLYATLSLTFRRASRTILEQNRVLEQTAAELRAAYEDLKRAQAQLVQSEKLASTGRLVAGMIHEIGNPLASVLGLLDLQLLCKGSASDRAECLDRTERLAGEIARLRGLLRSLLDYARPGPSAATPLDLNDVVEKSLVFVLSHKAFASLIVEKDLAPGLPPVMADESLLQQVLVNVLLNAAQASPPDGSITVTTQAGNGEEAWKGNHAVGRVFQPGERTVTIAISDTGPGIPIEHLERIFEPFFSTKARGEGAGLGLAICHSIIELLHGALAVELPPGGGATFRIVLPAGTAAPVLVGGVGHD
jgi:signal transduction histidine kinase